LPRLLPALAAATLLAGCGDAPMPADPLSCFPPEAARWLRGSAAAAARPQQLREASFYVDASGSMAGYLRTSTRAEERPLEDLLGTLPESLARRDIALTYHSFGTRIRPVPADQRAQLTDAATYRCSNCDNQTTRLDLVLRQVADRPQGLAVIVTDLWFADPASPTSGVTAMGAPIADILASGRAVSVYGIEAPYAGRVFDLPGGATFDGARRRPLFVLVIGEDRDVEEVHKQLSNSSSGFISRGVQTGAIRRSVFTLDPLIEGRVQQDPLRGGRDPRIELAPGRVLEAMPGVRIQQFSTSRRGASARTDAAPVAWHWQGPRQDAIVPNAVWAGPMRSHVRVWERRREGCDPANWFAAQPITQGWTDIDGGQVRFDLKPDEIVRSLGRPGVYLLTGEVTRTGIEIPNPANGWMRSWSFASSDAPAVVARNPALFPTLNLGEVARLFEIAQAEAAERRPHPIDGFSVVVKVED
jgi:hypothetical protein